MNHAARAKAAKAHVDAIRQYTVCVKCGSQPVHFHNAEHPQQPNRRICAMVGGGRTIEAIDAEIAVCTPLCPKCHPHEDRAGANWKPRHLIVNRTGGVLVTFPLTSAEYAMLTELSERSHFSRPTVARDLLRKEYTIMRYRVAV